LFAGFAHLVAEGAAAGADLVGEAWHGLRSLLDPLPGKGPSPQEHGIQL
jgi:hypothetical protein